MKLLFTITELTSEIIIPGEKNNIQSPGNEKTIMLVGATGSGVTDLVDGIVNYAMRVNYRDSYRFTVTWKPEKKGSHTVRYKNIQKQRIICIYIKTLLKIKVKRN